MSKNLLIGFGETLTSNIPRPSSRNTKKSQYSLDEARRRLAPKLAAALTAIRSLDAAAKPKGEAVVLFTVHPAYLSKSHMPHSAFWASGLKQVGSRAVTVIPSNDKRPQDQQEPRLAAQLYISGTETEFRNFETLLMSSTATKAAQEDFKKIEDLRIQLPQDRILGGLDGQGRTPIELVVHGEHDDKRLVDAIEAFAGKHGVSLELHKKFVAPGLIFMPGTADQAELPVFAQFSALRAVRPLPKLRLSKPGTRSRSSSAGPKLSEADALAPNLNALVFDGGIGVNDFERWVTEDVPEGFPSATSKLLGHGCDVTSALLFGALPVDCEQTPRPYFRVTHHRVLGAGDYDPDLYDCMKRIDAILQVTQAQFANFSIGPQQPVEDDHPHPWTCMLDRHLAGGKILATVAVGNDGGRAEPLDRIQPPADSVNALAVGAAGSDDFLWDRADYSCVGPGRSPGKIKPDGVMFGGTQSNPLRLFNPFTQGLGEVEGTSFAAPLALRVAAGAAALAETPLSATALRALMVHRSERSDGHQSAHVGWGRFPNTPEALLTCADNEATVLYQGALTAGEPIRARLPLPPISLGTRLVIKATFCFASPIDPADTLNYTKHGLTISFRPRGAGSYDDFFSAGAYGGEDELRKDASKWETILHRARSFPAQDLLDACFDVQHGARSKGRPVNNRKIPPLPYVLIVTVASDSAEAIYTSVLQRYQTLQPIRLREQVRL